MKKLIYNNTFYFFGITFLLIFAGCILLLFSKGEINLWVNRHSASWLDYFIIRIDQVGTVWFTISAMVVLGLWKGWKSALRGLVCIAFVALAIQFCKHMLFAGTPRPTLYFEEGTLRLIEGITQLKTESFPSGHTANAFAIATIAAFALKNRPYQLIFILLAALVGYGRIYLSQHFLIDVYFGMIISVAVASLMYLLMSRLLKLEV